jgi:hypothetical protein
MLANTTSLHTAGSSDGNETGASIILAATDAEGGIEIDTLIAISGLSEPPCSWDSAS